MRLKVPLVLLVLTLMFSAGCGDTDDKGGCNEISCIDADETCNGEVQRIAIGAGTERCVCCE